MNFNDTMHPHFHGFFLMSLAFLMAMPIHAKALILREDTTENVKQRVIFADDDWMADPFDNEWGSAFVGVEYTDSVASHTGAAQADEPPSFPNGEAQMAEWFSENLKYPLKALEDGVEGNVYVQFMVEEDGMRVCQNEVSGEKEFQSI